MTFSAPHDKFLMVCWLRFNIKAISGTDLPSLLNSVIKAFSESFEDACLRNFLSSSHCSLDSRRPLNNSNFQNRPLIKSIGSNGKNHKNGVIQRSQSDLQHIPSLLFRFYNLKQ